MSQETTQAVVHMLPPSFAVYLREAVIVPVLVKPGQDGKNGTSPTEVYVAPLVISAESVARIHWCLLSSDPNVLVEFEAEKPILFKDDSNEVRPFLGALYSMSATQIALDNFSLGVGTSGYDLYFRLRRGPSLGPVISAAVDADPSVAITPDPVDIPTWP